MVTPPAGLPTPRTLSASDIRSILDAIGDAILLHDGVTGALIDVNEAACALWGRRREDILGLDITALSCAEHPFSPADAQTMFERTRTEGPQSAAWLARRGDGRQFWVEMRTSLGRIDGRERLFATVRDVSRRKSAEDQLRASEHTFRGILDSVHEEICVQDAAGRLLDLNRAAERLFGLPREQLIGRSPSEFAAPGLNDFQRMHDAVRQTFAGNPQLFEFWCRHADGRVFPREVSVTPGMYFGSPAAIAVLRDISERKQAETERERAGMVLRESEERFRLLLGRVPTVAVQGYTPDCTVRYWNEASERLYGYTAAEALGRNLLELIIPPAIRAEVRQAIRTMVETGQSIPAGELDLMRKDGSIVSVFSSHAVVRTANSTPELYCLDVDLTERKRAERERLELQQRVARTDKLESLAVLAGGVAHDFNNLLTAILGNLDLARLELTGSSPVLNSIESAQAAARAAAELARQMLAFSGRSRMQLTRLDLPRFVRELVAEIRADIPPTVELVIRSGERTVPLLADADQIRQTVHNLVRNAVEAIQDVAQARLEISISALECDAAMLELSRTERKPEPGMFVALDVIDNGSGMSEETQRRMFEPFFTTRFAGRGLGLAVVMGVVRAHRGAILVRSRPGHGTSVRVLFPAERKDAALTAGVAPASSGAASATSNPAQANGPAPLPTPSGRPLALLVDDDPFVRLVFTRMAPLIGLDLVAAETGEDAVRMFQPRAAEFSVIILDLTLPGMSGWECHELLSALRPDIPIIISSGTATDGSAREFAGRKVAGVLPKPFTIEGLTQVLDAVGLKTRGR
jgi:PAS domain S-box-containing protein